MVVKVNMIVCYICEKVEPTITKFRAHLQRHNVIGELKCPILCCSCKSSFASIHNLFRHIETFHKCDSVGSCDVDKVIPSHNEVSSREEMDVCGSDVDGLASDNTAKAVECNPSEFYEDMCAEGISLVAGMRANSSIPFSVVPDVVQSFNQMANSLTSLLHAETANCLASSGIQSHIIGDVMSHLDERFNMARQPLDFLSSRYKQDNFFDNHHLAVKPESVVFGTNFCSQSGSTRMTYETFQYVSVQKTLQSLMQNRAFVEIMLQDKCTPGVLQEFVDGDKYKTHHLFSDSTKNSIMIQLFYDGLGVTNPLRGHSTLHNIGVFFYTIKNVPQRFNSCFANVHLLAVCYSQDIKKYGFDPILSKFAAEMNSLSRVGFAGTFPVIGEQVIYASLCQVTCDNLALNGILGFVECFSCDYFCTLCYASQEEIQTCFREELFERRTVHAYNQDVNQLKTHQGKKHVRGIKVDCRLNEIDGYHVTENWGLDVMHLALEGFLPLELGCILYGLCVVDKIVSFDTLKSALQQFWGKITVEKTHKPLELSKLEEPGQGLTPTMKAMQYWTLLKYLPLALGGFVAPDNKHWLFLLHLSHLVDLIFTPRFTQSMTTYMRSVIEDHLTMFVDNYGNNGTVKLRPKHHFLVHLPSIVLKCGPLVGMSCLRYELKNSFFKRSAHIVCNFTNICHTLAYRHQQRALFSLLSNAFCRSSPVVASQKMVPVSSLECCVVLCDKLGVVPAEYVSVAMKLCVATIQYKLSDYIVIDVCAQSGDPLFGKIVHFVSCSHSTDWYIVVQCLKTVNFCAHLHSFCVCECQPVVYRILTLDEMIDHHPLYCHSTVMNGIQQRFIRTPYHLFKP